MTIKAKIIANKESVNISIPEASISTSFKGIVLSAKGAENILEIGKDEDELKESITTHVLSLTEKDYQQFKKITKGFEDLDYMEFKAKSPSEVWTILKNSLIFIHPFDYHELRAKIIASVLRFKCQELAKSGLKPGLFERIFGTRYTMDITIEGFEKLGSDKQQQFMKELREHSKIFKIKEIHVSGNS